MSAIDDQIGDFCNHMALLSWQIEENTKWMKDYESKRMTYPAWETKDGTLICVYEIEDSRLDNLIPFVQKKDPNNKTRWFDVFKAEKRYRELKATLPTMQSELEKMRGVSARCL